MFPIYSYKTNAVHKRFAKRFEDLLVVLPYCNEATFYDNDNGFVIVAKYKNGELQPIGHNQPKWLVELIEKMNQTLKVRTMIQYTPDVFVGQTVVKKLYP